MSGMSGLEIIARRNVDFTTQAGGGLAIPELYPLAVIMGDVRSCEGRMAEKTPDVFCGFEAFGVEAVGINLEATEAAI